MKLENWVQTDITPPDFDGTVCLGDKTVLELKHMILQDILYLLIILVPNNLVRIDFIKTDFNKIVLN